MIDMIGSERAEKSSNFFARQPSEQDTNIAWALSLWKTKLDQTFSFRWAQCPVAVWQETPTLMPSERTLSIDNSCPKTTRSDTWSNFLDQLTRVYFSIDSSIFIRVPHKR
ncbi:hypothetical protein BpHYR1_039149 [Brachionus plicatilis]|uniref:Uncharacterized protein n=1 Tax=Brachionus plicatilis TaxID=10195 RepID=A0A3M7RJX1_BRAPC|nr:hypothetical protein BpHYR1_039149 [Brachionus plicatilis]